MKQIIWQVPKSGVIFWTITLRIYFVLTLSICQHNRSAPPIRDYTCILYHHHGICACSCAEMCRFHQLNNVGILSLLYSVLSTI